MPLESDGHTVCAILGCVMTQHVNKGQKKTSGVCHTRPLVARERNQNRSLFSAREDSIFGAVTGEPRSP